MKKLLPLLLCLALLPLPARAAAAPVYRYDLVDRGAAGLAHTFALTVSGTGADGQSAPVLHAGVVSLGLPKQPYDGLDLSRFRLEPAEHITLRTFAADTAAGGSGFRTVVHGDDSYEVGAAIGEDGVYLGFIWSVDQKQSPAGLADDKGVLTIGTLTVPFSDAAIDDLTLLPWTSTATGAAKYEEWKNASRKPPLATLIGANWRVNGGLEQGDPASGWYQGWYVPADEGQVQTDIRCAWSSLRIRSWSPQYQTTLKVYRGGDTSGEPAAALTLPKNAGVVGRRVVETVKLDERLKDLAPGEYTLVISKQSHVPVTCTGLTIAEESGVRTVFTELSSQTVDLPCGDLGPDDAIKQDDRARLTDRHVYGRSLETLSEAELSVYASYDLDNDGRVDSRDLAILTAPENYGRSARTLDVSKPDETGGSVQ